MVSQRAILAVAAIAAPAAALSGQATTTRYYDGQEGACGCGSSSGMFGWQSGIGSGIYTAAASQAIYDEGGSSWCGAGCGQCFQLTSTGSAPSGQGTGGTAGQTITVMVTNLCPNNGNAQWCPNPGQSNAFGYQYHFDIMASSSSVSPIIGDNPIVNFQSVSCPGQATSDYSQCICKNGSSGSTGSGSTGSGSTGSGSTGSGSGSSSSGTVAKYGQCGGSGYTGSTTCASGSSCKEQNQYYSQCL